MNKHKLERYSEYKDSGVDRIKKIPQHWEMEKGKWLYIKQDRPIRIKDEIVTCFRDGEVTLRSNRRNSGFTTALKEHGYQGIRKGDLVIHQMDAFAGAIGVSDSDGKSTPVYSVCTERIKNTVNNHFYAYYLKNLAHTGFIESLAKGIRERSTDFRFNDFSTLLLVHPPLEEQTRIANFLDDKCAKIDQAIQQKEQLIELLKERKQIIIQNAVTRGLNPDVTMKDSGVDWIGEIPEAWTVKRLKNIFNLSKGLTITKENLREEGIFCVNYGEIHSKYGFELDTTIHKLKCVETDYLSNNPKALIKTGDFVFADTSEDLGGSGNFTYLKSQKQIFAGYHTVIAKPKKELNSRFFAYEFDSVSFRNQIRTRVKGVKVYSITQSLLKQLTICIPPEDEQVEIVNFLNGATEKLNTAIKSQKNQIKKLKEYKQVLINEVVTGKVKV